MVMAEVKEKFFNMDGTWHYIGNDCCRYWEKRCRTCGSIVHRQPAYGCILDVCEQCDSPETIEAEEGISDEALDLLWRKKLRLN
jgi:hypothetical protein